jgi:uncharacterized protein (TIGR03435 family)
VKLAILVVFGATLVWAQPVFEAATVKVNDSGSNAMGGVHGFRDGGVHMVNFTLKTIIGVAYGVEEYRILAGPSWISSERYDIEAKPATRVSDTVAQSMLQALLAERFDLRVHRETRTVAGYRLLAEKADGKLTAAQGERVGFRIMSMEEIRGTGTMPMVAWVLKAILGGPVQDDTGLSGKYEIAVKFRADRPEDAGSSSEFGVSIFTALKQDLGLTLKAAQIPVEVVIVDHALKTPVPN